MGSRKKAGRASGKRARDVGSSPGRSSGRASDVVIGHYAKNDLPELARILRGAGVLFEVEEDREFSRRHHAATAINPVMRRRLTIRDVRHWFALRVPAGQRQAAIDVLRGTRLETAAPSIEAAAQETPDFDADPRYCPNCDAETPPRRKKCPDCGTPTVDILRQRRARAASHPPFWLIFVAGAVLLALAIVRLTR